MSAIRRYAYDPAPSRRDEAVVVAELDALRGGPLHEAALTHYRGLLGRLEDEDAAAEEIGRDEL